jgi:hypothetical protein
VNGTAMRRLGVLAVPAALAVLAAGCGEDKTDVSGGVDKLNQTLSPSGVNIDCPDEVDGGEGTTFECTLKGNGKEEKVDLKVVKQGDDLAVDVAEPSDFQRKLASVAGK